MLADVTLPEDELKKIETCHNISPLYVKMYFEYLCICWC